MGVRSDRDSRGNTLLWKNYRQTFELLREKVRLVQSIAANPAADRKALDTALVEAETARAEHNRARDLLVQEILRSDRRVFVHESAHDSPAVREIAELLWELAGRPHGTALEDWYRAEDIVRRASHCA